MPWSNQKLGGEFEKIGGTLEAVHWSFDQPIKIRVVLDEAEGFGEHQWDLNQATFNALQNLAGTLYQAGKDAEELERILRQYRASLSTGKKEMVATV